MREDGQHLVAGGGAADAAEEVVEVGVVVRSAANGVHNLERADLGNRREALVGVREVAARLRGEVGAAGEVGRAEPTDGGVRHDVVVNRLGVLVVGICESPRGVAD